MADVCEVIPHVDIPGICNRCGKKLTGRQTAWCSQECSDEFTRQHDWNSARRAARKRDNQLCVRCGQDGSDQRPQFPPKWEVFDRRPAMRELKIELPVGGFVYVKTKRDQRPWLEVNHIEPRLGRGYGWGCHNHLSGSETLCHACHAEVTAGQRKERRSA